MNIYYLSDYKNPRSNIGLYSILSYYTSNNPDKKIIINEQLHPDDFYNIINDENSYVLISIAFFNEFWKFDAIIKRLRKFHIKKYNLIIGGSAMMQFSYNELIKYYPELDFVVEGKGEFILENILNKKIKPGFYKDNLAKIPAYFLSDFFINEKIYDAPIPITFTGANCIWNKCEFCHHHDQDGHNNTPKEVFNMIKHYYTNYNKRDFFVEDNYLILQNFYQILDMLIAEGMNDVQFNGICMHIQSDYRKLGNYVSKFSRPLAGKLGWGVEFIDDEVLAMYRKGITVKKIFEHANFMNEINLPLHIFILLGLPNLSNKNIQNGLDNLIKYYDKFQTFGLSYFTLDSNMRMFSEPDKWNIQILDRIPLSIQYESTYPIETKVYNYNVFDIDNKVWISKEEYLKKFYQHNELLLKKFELEQNSKDIINKVSTFFY